MRRIFQVFILTALTCAPTYVFGQEADPEKTVFTETNAQGEVKVTESLGGFARKLYLNGRLIAFTGDGVGRRATYPFVVAPSDKTVLVYGLGNGAGPAAAILNGAKTVDVISNNPAIAKATTFFPSAHRGVPLKAKARVINSKGKWPDKGSYDIIIAGLTFAGSNNDYKSVTLSSLKNTSQLLAPKGIMALWLPLGQISNESMRSITATFFTVFPSVTVWYGDINPVDSWVMLMGSHKSITYDVDKIRERLSALAPNRYLAEGENVYSFLSFYISNKLKAKNAIKDVSPFSDRALAEIKTQSPNGNLSRSVENFMFWRIYRRPIIDITTSGQRARKKLISYFKGRGMVIEGRKIAVRGKVTDEIELYDKAAIKAPEDDHLALSYLSVGLMYYRSGLLGNAAELIEKAKKIAPDQPRVRFYLGKTYEKMGNSVKATAEFSELKKIVPGYTQRVIIKPKGQTHNAVQ